MENTAVGNSRFLLLRWMVPCTAVPGCALGGAARNPTAEHQALGSSSIVPGLSLLPCASSQGRNSMAQYRAACIRVHTHTHVWHRPPTGSGSWQQALYSKRSIFMNCLFHLPYNSAHPDPHRPWPGSFLGETFQSVSLTREAAGG